jgi:hypothetical protein
MAFITMFLMSLPCLLFSFSNAEFRCDFESLSLKLLTDEGSDLFHTAYQQKKPLILQNFLSEWPLDTSFVDTYGDLKVQTGSESSIVHSHGSADALLPLKELIQLGHCNNNQSESLSFDLDILKKNPQLLDTYKMPVALQPFFNTDVSSPVLSLGPVGSGEIVMCNT